MSFSFLGIIAVILEVLRPYWPLFVMLVIIEVVLLISASARSHKTHVTEVRKELILTGLVSFILLLLLAPLLTGARHHNLGSLVDYAALFGASFAGAIVITLLTVPVWKVFKKA
ncbi:MAG: hypothetical protein LAT77_09415 [Aliidiomarina sp.]|uniref:hypothetical protein n=1 Tax=Aliidiomarina sp. TaxID=1872439 RepID=UPI0025BDAFC5|nr:hypothetical protein [Aliidiomarina sp.]MCH8502111.1 hypothetical protein [Aliidiomarina sp.]